jgi:predicted transcriptional regulator
VSHRKVDVILLVNDKVKAMEVVKALSDEYSRRIILSLITDSLPIEEVSRLENIPISTCYRRLHEMQEFGIIKADKTIIRDDGKKYVCYKSAIKNVSILFEGGELKVDVVLNNLAAERVGILWSEVAPDLLAESPRKEKITPLLGA